MKVTPNITNLLTQMAEQLPEINDNDSHEIDRFRIKIWQEDELGSEDVIYDNGLGEDEVSTELGGGSIVIH